MLRRILSLLCFSCVLLFCLAELNAQTRDSLKTIALPEVRVEAKAIKFTSSEKRHFWRRIRDVKKVLPYARYITATMVETYEYMQTLPEDEQEDHLKRVRKDLKMYFDPLMRKLTVKQGQLLMQLIHRESGTVSYDLVKTFVGGFRAFFWQSFARMVGTNLKKPYRPKKDANDALTERIVVLVDLGLL